ncbi:MAG: MBL fold metallo-hydrolase [Acidobacteriota bacterium]
MKPMRWLAAIIVLVLLLLPGCSDSNKYSDSINGNSSKPAQPAYARSLQTHFVDVGQGDCILVLLPDSKTMLVDAGENDKAERVIQYIDQLGVRRIDYLVATHPHSDHFGGLPRIIRCFDIGTVFMPRVVSSTPAYEHLLLSVRDKGLKATSAHRGVFIVNEPDLKVECLSPTAEDYQELNNWSVVLRVQYKKTAFLLTADAGHAAEREMIDSGENLQANVIKISHHGSSDASTPAFLRNVKPQYAVISVGQGNDYGHPHQQTVNELLAMGARIYRTDQSGSIVVSSDGEKISIESSKGASLPRAPAVRLNHSADQKSSDRFIGNRRSHKFHKAQCGYLPSSQNRVYFTTRDEAIEAGYSPCGSCHP